MKAATSQSSTRQHAVDVAICRYQCVGVEMIEALCSAEAISLAKTLGAHGLCRLAISCKPWHRSERCLATIAVALQLCGNAGLASPVPYSPAQMRRLRGMMQPQCVADAVWWISRCLAMLLQTWIHAAAPAHLDILLVSQELCLSTATQVAIAPPRASDEESLREVAMGKGRGVADMLAAVGRITDEEWPDQWLARKAQHLSQSISPAEVPP